MPHHRHSHRDDYRRSDREYTNRFGQSFGDRFRSTREDPRDRPSFLARFSNYVGLGDNEGRRNHYNDRYYDVMAGRWARETGRADPPRRDRSPPPPRRGSRPVRPVRKKHGRSGSDPGYGYEYGRNRYGELYR